MFDCSEMSTEMATRLKALRQKKELTREQLSREIWEKYNVKVSADSIGNYETVYDEFNVKSGRNNGMSAKNLRALALYFGVSSDYLLGLTQVSAPDPSELAACEYTGLTEENVKMLHEFVASDSKNWRYGKINPENARFPGLDLVNDFLECVRDERLMQAEYWFLRYASHIHSTSGDEYKRVEEYRECAEKLQEYGMLSLKASDTIEFNSRRLATRFERLLTQKYTR